ncbi:hypothetical protein ACFY7A_35630 [Streptomyces longwoodensis]|uniref:hypothetical protein n=1 Tax=Streptomyces longwoodensis TaxID=68231 RepID=UPI0036B45D8E
MRNTSNPELAAAWATVPDVAEAQKRHEAAVRLRRDFPPGVTPVEALAGVQGAAAATFMSTGEWPADFAKQAAKAHADAVVWEAEVVALRQLETSTKADAEFLRDVLSADVLEHLAGRLGEILDAAKDAGEALGSVTTPEQAIEAGGEVLDAWRRLTGLLSDFRNVRAAQWDVLRSVTGDDERARIRTWNAEGHGEIKGVPMADVPSHIVDVMRSGAYTIEYLVWLAQSGAAYVPTSYEDLATTVEATTEPVVYDDHGPVRPVRDISPTVTPIRQPRPAEVYAHSTAPLIDKSKQRGPKPTPNASHPDRERSTTDYF